jgi:hypothetical protein
MNRNDFLNMIDDSVPVNRQMLGEVYELIDIFPYFQSAHLLLLKGLFNNSDVKFENQLRLSAIHIGDREILYWLLRKKNSLAQETVTTTGKGNDKIIEAPPAIIAEADSEETLPEETDTQQTVIESAKNSDYLINDIEKDEDPGLADKTESIIKHPGHSILITAEPENTELAGVIFLPDEEITETEEKVFFMDPGFSIPEKAEDLLELDLADNEQVNIESEEVTQKNVTTGVNSKQMQSDLIDKFIIANPRIEPQKDKSYVQNPDISKPFVEESDGLVTETLAKIYVGQGYYSRAIDIYEKLSLKFPEKSSYFASQIEKVKEYIKK